MSLSGILHAYSAATHAGPWAGLGVVFVDGRGRVLRRVGRASGPPRATSPRSRAFSALCGWRGAWGLAASSCTATMPLWWPRSTDGNKSTPTSWDPTLQVRALCHTYRSASVEARQAGPDDDALAMAEAAATFDVSAFDVSEVVVEDLPLWSWQTPPNGRPPNYPPPATF
jgi:hypothetical protein